MNKTIKTVISAFLCAVIAFSGAVCVAFAQPAEAPVTDNAVSLSDYLANSDAQVPENLIKAQRINKLSNTLLNGVVLKLLSFLFPQGANTISMRKFNLDNYGDFFEGHQDFLSYAKDTFCWQLGYSEKSILPADFGKAEKKYARGSYVPWWFSKEIYKDEDGNDEDLRVRTFILDDGSGRGSVAFCVVDCIGLANADIRKIRAAVSTFAGENNIVSINISATHTHSGIDSQGVWTAPLSTIFNNSLSAFTGGLVKFKNGTDEDFLQTVIDQTAASIKEAYQNLEPGELTYAVRDISDYLYDRTPPYCRDNNLYRLMFNPEDGGRGTVIATFGCHPESASYDWLKTDDGIELDTKISADFVYYMEKIINRAGFNFVYIQGDVGTTTSSRGNSNDGGLDKDSHEGAMRYGYELGLITLGMDKSEAACAAMNTQLGDPLGVAEHSGEKNYSVWYADWGNADEAVIVEPYLNIKHSQFLIEVENNMALILSKSGLANVKLIYDYKTMKYYTVTEIGYMEVGSALKVFLCPGETFPELVSGNERLEDFPYDSLRSLFGENLIVCDLMNDAAGYIEPDNYYTIAGYQYDEVSGELKSDTWCLLVSMGKNTASLVIGEFIDLVNSVRTSTNPV